jgi:putative ABC transport system permease protein
VALLILVESLMLSAAGAIAGTVVGLGALSALQSASWFRGKIDATASLPLLMIVLLSTLVLGAVAGLYPAWVGARMRPADGLRHE